MAIGAGEEKDGKKGKGSGKVVGAGRGRKKKCCQKRKRMEEDY